MSYALDANILLRAIQKDHSQQAEALAVITKLLKKAEDVFLLPQAIYEFWVVATRPTTENGLVSSS